MKAITIIQPYAELIARGDKRVENRTWVTHYRGPLAIHAGVARSYQGCDVRAIAETHGVDASELVFGCVVAVAELVDCVKMAENRGRDSQRQPFVVPVWAREKYPWLIDHHYATGPVCWVLQNVRRLSEPVRAVGWQGLWDIDLPADAGEEAP